MSRFARHLVLAAALLGALSIAHPALAEEEQQEAAHGEQHADKDEHKVEAHGEPGPGHATHAEGTPEHHAEHHEEEGITNWWGWDKSLPPPFGWALINFGIFLYVLSRIVWRPMKAGIADRHDKIKGELGEAQRLRKEAEAQLAEYKKKVANVDREVETLLVELRKEADGERARIVAAATAEARRLKEEADRQIKVEIERARAELRRTTVEAAMKAAEQILTQNVTNEDQHRLAERYLVDVEKAAPRGPQGGVA